jgi:uncharacterized membrane protein HdeD (DUF308 family)
MSNETNVDIAGAGVTLAALKKGRKWLLVTGILMIIVGILAFVFPVATTFVAEQVVGWVFIFAGVVMLFGSFSIQGAGPFFGALLWSLLTGMAGAFLVFNPEAGVVTLTIVIAALFMFHGAYELFLAFDLRPQKGWGWVLLSSIIGIGAGVLIAADLHGSSVFGADLQGGSVLVLGILVGVNFLSTGISYVILANRLK